MKKKNSFVIYQLIVLGLVLMLTSYCKKEDTKRAPVITTSALSDVAHTTATCGGSVTNNGGAAITEQGVCYGTAPGPTISNGKTPAIGPTGSFVTKITGLTGNTTYYLRAYATNSAGTSYGEEVSFKTHQPVAEGSMSGCFNNVYRTFSHGIERVQPVDSFSNCYLFEDCKKYYSDICHGPLRQINLIRCDSAFEVDIFINGISPDSLPAERPIPGVFCRTAEIQCYKLDDWDRTPNNNNSYQSPSLFYGSGVIITDNSDDVLSGTFEGDLVSPAGEVIHVAGGEFKIRIVRKRIPCWHE